MIFTSEIIRCNVPNKNGHVYTKECVEKALDDPIIKERLSNNCLFGGFMRDYKDSFSIDISKVSHAVKGFWWEDNVLYGEFETLDTPCGKILERFLSGSESTKSDCMALSGVARTNTDENGNYIVDRFGLSTINFTADK